jgi:hypothetical protein
VDEACGVPKSIFDAIDALATNSKCLCWQLATRMIPRAPTLPRRQVMVAHAGPCRSRSCASPDGIGSTTSAPTSGISMWIPTTPALAMAIRIVQRARRPSAYARRCLARISRPPRQAEQVSAVPRTYRTLLRRHGRSGALLLDPRSAQCPLSRSLTLRERARLTGRRRPRQRLLQLGAIWAPNCAPPLLHSTR